MKSKDNYFFHVDHHVYLHVADHALWAACPGMESSILMSPKQWKDMISFLKNSVFATDCLDLDSDNLKFEMEQDNDRRIFHLYGDHPTHLVLFMKQEKIPELVKYLEHNLESNS